jgi:hypothetical protein
MSAVVGSVISLVRPDAALLMARVLHGEGRILPPANYPDSRTESRDKVNCANS